MTDLGNRLKEAREAKGMSLDDLQEITKIQKRYLAGIEEGNYKMMPGPFYVRAFIRQYAEAVDLVPEEIFEQYKDDIPSTHDDVPENLSRVQTRKKIDQNSTKIFDLLPKILVIIFVVAIIFLFWFFYQNSKDDPNENINNENVGTEYEESEDLTKQQEEVELPGEQEDNANPPENELEEEKNTEEQQPEQTQEITVVEQQGKNTVYELNNANEFRLKVVSTGETWVNILNGQGKSLFQGILSVGGTESQEFDFTNEKEAVIIIGRASDTEIYINDEKLEFALPPEKQVTQNIRIRYNQNE